MKYNYYNHSKYLEDAPSQIYQDIRDKTEDLLSNGITASEIARHYFPSARVIDLGESAIVAANLGLLDTLEHQAAHNDN